MRFKVDVILGRKRREILIKILGSLSTDVGIKNIYDAIGVPRSKLFLEVR